MLRIVRSRGGRPDPLDVEYTTMKLALLDRIAVNNAAALARKKSASTTEGAYGAPSQTPFAATVPTLASLTLMVRLHHAARSLSHAVVCCSVAACCYCLWRAAPNTSTSMSVHSLAHPRTHPHTRQLSVNLPNLATANRPPPRCAQAAEAISDSMQQLVDAVVELDTADIGFFVGDPPPSTPPISPQAHTHTHL